MDTGYFRLLSRKSVIFKEYIPKSLKYNNMIYKFRIILVLAICLMQIAGIMLADKSRMLSLTSEEASITIVVINDEFMQIIPCKRIFPNILQKINTFKQATL